MLCMLPLVLYIGFKLDVFVRLIFAYVLVTYHEPLVAMGKFIVYFFRLQLFYPNNFESPINENLGLWRIWSYVCIQWSLCIMDALRLTKSSLIIEVS